MVIAIVIVVAIAVLIIIVKVIAIIRVIVTVTLTLTMRLRILLKLRKTPEGYCMYALVSMCYYWGHIVLVVISWGHLRNGSPALTTSSITSYTIRKNICTYLDKYKYYIFFIFNKTNLKT